MENFKKANPGAHSDVGEAPIPLSSTKPSKPTVTSTCSADNKKLTGKSGEVPSMNSKSGEECTFSATDSESGLKALFGLFSRDISMSISSNTTTTPMATEMIKGPLNRSKNAHAMPVLGVIAAVDNHKVWVPSPLIEVDNGPIRCYDPPTATPFGAQLLRMLDAEVQVTRVTD